ncbi:MAG: DUF2867 domain-containing protein [Nakamurella sp.]
MWRARGLVDRVAGGPGFRSSRPEGPLRVGDTLDWWRVEEVEAGKRLLLRAETKMPGKAWLELTVEPDSDGPAVGPEGEGTAVGEGGAVGAGGAGAAGGAGGATLNQRAVFLPHGLAGHAYWGSMLPGHLATFALMHRGMVRAAERTAGEKSTPAPAPTP